MIRITGFGRLNSEDKDMLMKKLGKGYVVSVLYLWKYLYDVLFYVTNDVFIALQKCSS